MRLNFKSFNLWDPQNMSKPIPYCSNFNKIVFWAWWGSNFIESKNFFYKVVFSCPKEPKSRCRDPKSKFCILSPPAISLWKSLNFSFILFETLKVAYWKLCMYKFKTYISYEYWTHNIGILFCRLQQIVQNFKLGSIWQ